MGEGGRVDLSLSHSHMSVRALDSSVSSPELLLSLNNWSTAPVWGPKAVVPITIANFLACLVLKGLVGDRQTSTGGLAIGHQRPGFINTGRVP